MNKLKKILSIVLALVILAAGIYTVATQSAAPSDGTGGSAVEQPNALQPAQPDTPAPDDDIIEGAYYYDVESIVLYLDAFGRLPDNYITKSEAEKLGWSGGSVERFRAGAAIGATATMRACCPKRAAGITQNVTSTPLAAAAAAPSGWSSPMTGCTSTPTITMKALPSW